MPFLNSYKYCIDKYHPFLKGVDTTGTQKAIDELAFENVGISVDGINFGSDKNAMLNSLSMSVSRTRDNLAQHQGYRQAVRLLLPGERQEDPTRHHDDLRHASLPGPLRAGPGGRKNAP